MKILTAEQIRSTDAYTIQYEPVDSVDLMERAALQCVRWIISHFDKNNTCKIFVGPGNNGGDGWAIARLLADKDYEVNVFLLNISPKLSTDSAINRERLEQQGKAKIFEISDMNDFPVILHSDIVIDALFGTGLSRPLEGLAVDLVKYLNQNISTKISIDIPSGLFAEDNSNNNSNSIIKADYTLSFQFPKLSFFFPENEDYIGRWFVLPIGLHTDYIAQISTPYFYLPKSKIQGLIKPRKKFSHKGTYGHALLIAGSYGMMGAAVLASKACMRSGVGLLTAHIPRLGYQVIQNAIPEVIVSIDDSDVIFTSVNTLSKYNAIAIGPGLGLKPNSQKGIQKLLTEIKVPLIIDADGINILAENKDWLKFLPKNTILTPHPKEFERLVGSWENDFKKLKLLIQFAQQYNVNVVLKGAYTCIASSKGDVWFNTTGNAGMATGGTGDVLTGIILGFLAQGYESLNAAKLGVFIHGLSADIAVSEGSMESLIASDIIDNLGKAFKELNEKGNENDE